MSTTSPIEFFNDTVAPAVFDQADRVFAEFSFVRNADGGWTATDNATTHRVFGVRADRVIFNHGTGFYIHGDGHRPYLAHVAGTSTPPRGADFIKAVRELANRVGVSCAPIDRELSDQEVAGAGALERRQAILEAFARMTGEALRQVPGNPAETYLTTKRGVQPEEIPGLPLGFCPPHAEVQTALLAQGFSADEIGASGVVADPRWEGRLTIVQRDATGRIETMIARDLTGTAEASKKYLKLKGAKAMSPLFGLSAEAISAAKRQGYLLVVEGYMDVAIFQARGFLNVAATGGNFGMLTGDRWKALHQLGVRIVLATDNDPKLDGSWVGREKLLEALDKLNTLGEKPQVAVVPPERYGTAKDPDEFVRAHGLDALRGLVVQAVTWRSYRLHFLLGDVQPDHPEEARLEAARKAVVFTTGIRGEFAPLEVEGLHQQVAARTGYSVGTLKEVAKTVEDRKKHERKLQRAKNLAKQFDADLAKPGADPAVVASKYAREFDDLKGEAAESLPPTFSVNRIIDDIRATPGGYPVGLSALNVLGVRLQPGGLTICGARTGHGKTSFMTAQFLNALGCTPKPCILYSFEEPEDSIACRLAALRTAQNALPGDRWGYAQIRDHLKNPAECPANPDALRFAFDQLRELEPRIVIAYVPGWPISKIVQHARQLAEQHGGLGAVFLDYLQRVPAAPGKKSDRRDIEIAAVGRALKDLAVELKIPVVAGAQINREAIPQNYAGNIAKKLEPGAKFCVRQAIDYMKAARPELHHLREGGSEQEADMVLGLMNYNADLRVDGDAATSHLGTTLYEIGVLKNRYGQVGRWARLSFDGRTGLFRDREPRDDREEFEDPENKD